MHAQYYKAQRQLATRYTATVPQVAKVLTVDQASAPRGTAGGAGRTTRGVRGARPTCRALEPGAGTSRVAPAKRLLHKAQEAVPGQQAAQQPAQQAMQQVLQPQRLHPAPSHTASNSAATPSSPALAPTTAGHSCQWLRPSSAAPQLTIGPQACAEAAAFAGKAQEVRPAAPGERTLWAWLCFHWLVDSLFWCCCT